MRHGEVYLRNQDGDTEYLPLREGLKKFLDPALGYRITFEVDGVQLVLRNSFDADIGEDLKLMDERLDQKTVLVSATIKGL